MIFKYTKILVLGMFFLTLSCNKSKYSPTEYVNWCDSEENGLSKEFTQNELKLTCQFMTSEYAVLKQNDPNNLVEQEINENINALSDLRQFKLIFENTQSTNFLKDNYTTAEQFNTRSMYLSYDIQSDLRLVEGEDTVNCIMNHYERSYGNTPYETLLVSFPSNRSSQNDLELIFDDRVFGYGRVKFFFEKSLLESIPELAF